MFKIGDIVSVRGRQDAIIFSGEQGRIVCLREDCAGYPYNLYGVDFTISLSNILEKYRRCFHRLDGKINYCTGYFIAENLLFRKEGRTGFGKFIRKIEGA